MSGQAKAEPNCPFYGRYLRLSLLGGEDITQSHVALVASKGNQCAICIAGFVPCDLAIHEKPVDWRNCHLLAVLTLVPSRSR